MTAPSVARSRDQVGELGPGLWRLGYIVVADLAFVFGVLVPHLTDDDVPPVDSTWDALFWPGMVSVFFLPLVACGVGLFSGAALRRGDGGGARAADMAAVVLSVAGVLVYASPWGRDAISWLLD
jgi:hypothetical protein